MLGAMISRLETKFTQMVKGLVVVLVLQTMSEAANIIILKTIMKKIVDCGPLVGVVLFQPEIRSALEYLGRMMHIKKRRSLDEGVLLGLEKAVQCMSERRIGALITLERNMDLEEFIETGTRLNADVTGELLINIFTPNTPLHDGAVIIRAGKIIAASAYLPLSHSKTISNKYGTRHRAALGVSEMTDSITIVVSEESGEISVSFQGALTDNLTLEKCLHVVKKEMTWM